MVGLTEYFSLARQYAGHGITVNAIAPCYVFSPMISEQLTQEQRKISVAKNTRQEIL